MLKFLDTIDKRIYGFLIIPMIVTIVMISWFNYKNIRDTIISQEQQNLLTIADTAADTLELYVREQGEALQIISKVKSFQEDFKSLLRGEVTNVSALEFLYHTQSEINNVQLLDREGNIVDRYPLRHTGRFAVGRNISGYLDVQKVLKDHQASYGNVFFTEEGVGFVSFLEPIYYEKTFEGVIRVTIHLDTIYNRLIEPIKVGKKGYASVKDQNGILLMHPKSEDIGNNVIDARKSEFPRYDWSELEGLVEKQKRGEKGVGIYHSIWYSDKDLSRVKKFNAYSPAYIGDGFWVVNVSMDYVEILDMIRVPLYNIFGFALFMMVLLGIGLFNFGKMREEKEKLEVQSFLIYQSRLATMGEMVGNIAHQWRQPLGSLSLILSNLKDSFDYGELNEQYMNESVGKAGKILRKMSETIDDFLFFFNPKRSKEEFLIYNNILYCVEMCEERLKLNEITVDFEVINEAKLYGYSNQFSQVVFNLINNSIDALIHSTGEKKMLLVKIFETDTEAVAEVIDNGGGIDEEILSKIYDPHFTTKSEKQGTGLGLYMSQMIVERNFAGTLHLENVENGVCARISIPKYGDDSNG